VCYRPHAQELEAEDPATTLAFWAEQPIWCVSNLWSYHLLANCMCTYSHVTVLHLMHIVESNIL
jgi:hypothetical protein